MQSQWRMTGSNTGSPPFRFDGFLRSQNDSGFCHSEGHSGAGGFRPCGVGGSFRGMPPRTPRDFRPRESHQSAPGAYPVRAGSPRTPVCPVDQVRCSRWPGRGNGTIFVILSAAKRSRRISRYAHLEIPRQARDDIHLCHPEERSDVRISRQAHPEIPRLRSG